MCTAITYNGHNHYLARNLDLELRYDESITITPRNYILRYRSGKRERKHYAIIGTATVIDDYPLYYDAANEFGLSIAALNFLDYAEYCESSTNLINIAPYELPLYILGKYTTVEECREALKTINLVSIAFNEDLPVPSLHWLIADKNSCIVLECTKHGMKIYENTIGILSNNPPFEYQLMNVNNYINVTNKDATDRFSEHYHLNIYSRGMGGIGLPGDMSSMSRFVRAAFTKLNSVTVDNKADEIGQVFHILSSVYQVEGTVKTGNKYVKTQYSACCDLDDLIYYYTTYENNQITAISLKNENLDTDRLISYKMNFQQQIRYIN